MAQRFRPAISLADGCKPQLRPDGTARDEKIHEVLAVTKRVGVEKMGFVGDEQHRGSQAQPPGTARGYMKAGFGPPFSLVDQFVVVAIAVI